ncbi:uncharacterized protein LOC127859706 [Dreissena polymorpha]|uniref:uncharacterized protein LOC127859706 n=1 Tax=Dreissena polymorpha TaxID=45954 RepID=UPI0022642587|nr:uncharacterized protein LOC127859706 [Dreissena polymorpha]
MDAAMEQQTYWTAKQNLALSMVKAGHTVYIGGQAGCGKSTLVLKPMAIHKWCGVRDGRMCSIKLRGMMATDDRLIPARNRILSTDILIIDEISMFSRRMFDMLETVLRIKDTSHTFGNIQIIVVGDFLQLPPVRNLRYEDLGEFAFTSKFWPPHSIFLDSVFRQRDESLISLIRELSLGQLSNDSQKLITSLARELPQEDGKLVKLYATNILVDLHNRSRIMDLDGQMYSFQSTDKGDERALNTLVVPPTLWLKIGCRVMLLKNLSDRLMNGLQGEVRDTREDAVHVFFPMLHEVATILRCAFTRYTLL